MQLQIEVKFFWRLKDIKEAIYAVSKAVSAGYNTKDKLITVLPQFSTYRIALAIDALITADMAKINFGSLTIHPDMDIVFEIVDNKFILPLDLKNAKVPAIQRRIINELGCKNPAGVQSLLNISINEV